MSVYRITQAVCVLLMIHPSTGECWEMVGHLRALCFPSLGDFKGAVCHFCTTSNPVLYIYTLPF